MRSILFTVFLLLSLSTSAQEYIPLVEEGNSWSVVAWSWGNAWTQYYFIEGDTSINSINYKKVYRTPDSLFQDDVTYDAAIREDTVNREVFCYYSDWSGENRLYKFGLEVNDTISVWSQWCGSFIATIMETDTTTDLHGIERRRMKVEVYGAGWNYDEYWIEGIGSTMGLFSAGNFSCIADLNFEFLCFSMNHDLYYMNPLYDTCYVTQVGLPDYEKDQEGIFVSPNPVVDRSRIIIPENTMAESIYIVDPSGRTINEVPVNAPFIENKDLNAGLYILRVSTRSGKVMGCKFIIQ